MLVMFTFWLFFSGSSNSPLKCLCLSLTWTPGLEITKSSIGFCQYLVCYNWLWSVYDIISCPHLWCTAGCCSAHNSSSWQVTGRAASPPYASPHTNTRCRKPRRTRWGPMRWGKVTAGSGYVWTCSPALLLSWKAPSTKQDRVKTLRFGGLVWHHDDESGWSPGSCWVWRFVVAVEIDSWGMEKRGLAVFEKWNNGQRWVGFEDSLVEEDEVLQFNHKETDVQARGWRKNSDCPPAPESVKPNQPGSSDFLSSRCYGTSQARCLTPHISPHRAATLRHVSTAIAVTLAGSR